MPIINVTVDKKIAVTEKHAFYVCGNSDYVIRFAFDAEWEAHEPKTARFNMPDGTYQERVFTRNECPVPIIEDTYSFNIGVYAGNLYTTTPAYIPAKKSILCGGGVHAEPEPDVYNQLIETIEKEIKTAVDAADLSVEKADAATQAAERAETSERNAADSAAAAKDSENAAQASAENAAESEANAALSADHAEQAAAASGWMDMEINDAGHLIYIRSETVDAVDFEMQEGRLIVSYG